MRRPEGSAGHPRKLSARLLRRLNLCRLLRFVCHRANPAGGGDFAGVFGPDRLKGEVVDRLRCRDCGAASASAGLLPGGRCSEPGCLGWASFADTSGRAA